MGMRQIPVVRRAGSGVVWRVTQFVHALAHRHDPATDDRLRTVLQNEAQWRLLLRLSAFDRAHHVRVHDALVTAGHSDPDLLLAAALHDVGKADELGRVHLAHRVLKVLLGALWPALLDALARNGGGWLRHGLYLAQHHPRLGGEFAATAGASPRCCELISRHEERLPVDDPQLRALIQADSRATS